MSTTTYNNSELTTTVGDVGQYDYVVNIQKFFKLSDSEAKLSYAVGVLVGVQSVLTACSVFYEAFNNKEIDPERRRYKDFRIVADGVTGHFELLLDGRRIRFIDTVQLHPKCAKPEGVKTKWRSDVCLAHTSFAFHLDPGHVGLIKFGNVTGGFQQLLDRRTLEFEEILSEHSLTVFSLGSNTAVCHAMSWGKYERLTDPTTGDTIETHISPMLLLYRIRLIDDNSCETLACPSLEQTDNRFCDLSNSNDLKVACAVRGDNPFQYEGIDYSDYPCTGTEGSPVICHQPDIPGKFDIYGIVTTVPKNACLPQSSPLPSRLPLVFTRIDEISKFVIDVMGDAVTVRQSYVVSLFPVMLFAEYIFLL